MRRHTRLKGPAHAICTVCAGQLNSIRGVTQSGFYLQHRNFRNAAAAAQQHEESQGWTDGPSHEFLFQPAPLSVKTEEDTRSTLARDREQQQQRARTTAQQRRLRERDEDDSAAADRIFKTDSRAQRRPPAQPRRGSFIKMDFAGGTGSSKTRAHSKTDGATRRQNQRGQATVRITKHGVRERQAVSDSKTNNIQFPRSPRSADSTISPRERALNDIAQRIAHKGMPPLDITDADVSATSAFPEVEPTQESEDTFWSDNDAWNDDSSISTIPPELQAKLDQQKARLEAQQKLEQSQSNDAKRAELADVVAKRKEQKQRDHAALLERQRSLADQRRREEKKPTNQTYISQEAVATPLEQGTAFGSLKDQRRDEIGEKMRQVQRIHSRTAVSRVQEQVKSDGHKTSSAATITADIDRTNATTNASDSTSAISDANQNAMSGLSEAEEALLAKLLARKTPKSSSGANSTTFKTKDETSPKKVAAGIEDKIADSWQLDPPSAKHDADVSNESSSASRVLPFDPSVTSQWRLFGRHRGTSTQEPSPKNLQAPHGPHADPPTTNHSTGQPQVDKDDHAAYTRNLFSSQSTPRQSRRADSRECWICHQAGHLAIDCPNREQLNRPTKQAETSVAADRLSHTSSNFDAGDYKDALSALTEEFDAQEKPQSTSFSTTNNKSPFYEASQTDKPAYKERSAWTNVDGEARITLKSRKFAEVDEERPERKPRRKRHDDEDDLEDEPFGGRRRTARRSITKGSEEDGDEERPRRGRRRERDEEDEGLDETSDLRRIRDRRQRDRDNRKQKVQAEERRKIAIAAKRSQTLTKITLPQFITVAHLAQALSVKLEKFTRTMEGLGFDNTAHDHVLSAENASLIALEFNFDPSIGTDLEVVERDLAPRPAPEDQSSLAPRPPIVTIMGHVDHGKTTILDFLRKSSVAASEHGGITQHIGAFSVRMSGGKLVTFLDTPGHAAFLSMRKRGANVTDIVILVVAADDSVKPQTLEALKHAREANVPIIVAVNKVDKPEADVQKVKQDLARHGVEIEDFGGDVQVVPVSGKTGKGMGDLEESIVTLGEILDNRAEDSGLVEGWILEATTKAAGRVATVLVRRGTLKPGSIVVAGQTWARVRTLQNEAGVAITSAGPGTPVEVDGWRDQPMAGDMVLETETEQKATDVVDYRVELASRQKLAEDVDAINEARRLEQEKRDREKDDAEAAQKGFSLSDATGNAAESSSGPIEVPFIIKADVSGSAEAVEGYLQQLINPVCSPKILRTGVGAVSEFDVEHAAAAGGHIVTFNLPTPAGEISGLAHCNKVKLVEQNVIYRLLEQIKTILEDKLEPTKTQRVTGEAEVLKPFDIGIGGRKKLRIAGSKVRNGEMKRNSRVRVLRKGVKVYDGVISSLKNVKKDVTEMRKGTECGVGFEEWTDAQEGDQIQAYEEVLEKRSLPI